MFNNHGTVGSKNKQPSIFMTVIVIASVFSMAEATLHLFARQHNGSRLKLCSATPAEACTYYSLANGGCAATTGGPNRFIAGGTDTTPPAIREYVYSPDYVDEVICQYDELGEGYYYLQDANDNVTALIKPAGGGAGASAREPSGERYRGDCCLRPSSRG